MIENKMLIFNPYYPNPQAGKREKTSYHQVDESVQSIALTTFGALESSQERTLVSKFNFY